MAWFRASLPVLALLAVLPYAEDVSACSPDACAVSDRWQGFSAAHSVVAADGVLVFRTLRITGALSDAEALAYVSIRVSDQDNNAVDGALEVVEGSDLVIFRPAAGLSPGSLTATVEIDNASIDDTECGLDEPEPSEFEVSAESLPALALPELSLEQFYNLTPSRALQDLVCCDGAYPEEFPGSCFPAEWTEGYCTALRGYGSVSANLDLGFEIDALLATNTMVRLVSVLESDADLAGARQPLQVSGAELFEVRYELVNLVTGAALTSDAVSIGEAHEGELGAVEIDVGADLEAACTDAAYVCEVVETRGGLGWDPEDCMAYAPGTGESGDGSDSGDESGSGDDDGTASGSDESGGESGNQTDTIGGCGCTAGSAPVGWTGLLVLGCVGLRRRRSTRA